MTEQVWKKFYNGLGDDDFLEVEGGVITISDEIGHMHVSTKITDILLGNPTGKPIKFDCFYINCTCGERDCESYAVIFDDGGITVRREDGDRYSTKIDPRYTARIYEYCLRKQKANAKAKIKRDAKKANGVKP